MNTMTDLCTPWSLTDYRDGQHAVCVIRDAMGNDIVAARPVVMPECPDDHLAMPDLYWQLRLMTAAPKLLAACKLALAAIEFEMSEVDPLAFTQIDWEVEPLVTLRAAIAEAEGDE